MIPAPRSRRATLLLVASPALLLGTGIEPDFDPWKESATYEIEYSIDLSIGRDRVLAPPQQGPARNYLIHLYAEADGVPIEKLPFEFRYRRSDVRHLGAVSPGEIDG